MPAIQNGDGQEVDQKEVNAERRHELHQIGQPHFRLFARHLGDENGAADALQRHFPGHQFIQALYGQPGKAAGIDHAERQGLDGADLLHGRSIPGRDADDYGRDFASKDVGGLHELGGHLDLEVPVAPPYRQGQGLFPVLPDFAESCSQRLTA